MDTCSHPGCDKRPTRRRKDASRWCQKHVYGTCACGVIASFPSTMPDSDSGVCRSCHYGPCVVCGNKANTKNPDGPGSLCLRCKYGKETCGCGKPALYPASGDHGPRCHRCRAGQCSVCGNAAVMRGDGDTFLCPSCHYGPCSFCGNKSSGRNEAGLPACARCRNGKCACGKTATRLTPNTGLAVCTGCFFGACSLCGNVANSLDPATGSPVCTTCRYGKCHCGRKAVAPNPNGGTPLCSTHLKRGEDYERAGSWHDRITLLYVVTWSADHIIKVGRGIGEDRHGQWLNGGATLLALYTGKASDLNDAERRVVTTARLDGWVKPTVLNDSLVRGKNAGTECFTLDASHRPEDFLLLVDLVAARNSLAPARIGDAA